MGHATDHKDDVRDVRLFRKACSYPDRKTARRSISLLLLLLPAVLLAGSTRSGAQTSSPHKTVLRRNAKSKFTGDNGSTGTADFQGNFTTIQVPSGQALVLFRQPDCSLSLGAGTYYVDSGKYSQSSLVGNYERTLHSEAGLTTTPDVFAKPCSQRPVAGLNATPMVFVGNTTKGIGVFAAIGPGSTHPEPLHRCRNQHVYAYQFFLRRSRPGRHRRPERRRQRGSGDHQQLH